MYYRTASIMLNAGQKSGTASDIFIAQPDLHKESLAGKLFILIEIDSEKSEALKIIDFIINNINHNYYQNEKVVLRERMESLKVEHIFETALAKTNKDLVEFLGREKIKISPYAFNLTVAVVHEDNIHFSTVGKNKNFLLYEDKIQAKSSRGEKETEYRITEVSDSKERKAEQISLTKLFSEVTSGGIPPNGYFLLVNEALSEYLSNKQLTEIVTTLPPQGAATQIKNTLQQVNAAVTFLGIIIKNTTTPEKEPGEEEENGRGTAEESAAPAALDETEKETENILSPSGIINFRRWKEKITSLKEKIPSRSDKKKSGASSFPSPISSGKKLFPLKDKIFFKKRRSYISPAHFYAAGKKILLLFQKITAGIWKRIKETEKNKERFKKAGGAIKEFPGNAARKTRNIPAWIRGLSKKNKFLLGAIIIIVATLATNLFLTDVQQEEEQKEERRTALSEQISANLDKIEANLLYSDEEGAKELLRENRELVEELKGLMQEEEAEEYEDLFARQEEFSEELRHAIDLEGAERIVDLGGAASEVNAANISLSGDNLYVGDGGAAYRINIEEGNVFEINTSEDSLDSLPSLKHPSRTGGNNIHYLAGNRVVRLQADQETLEEVGLELSEEEGDPVSMAGFGDNIYLLSSQRDQIYKHQGGGNTFTEGEEWLTGSADLAGAVDMAIDGNIFVLKDAGEVGKYLTGEEEELRLDSIDPSLKKPLKLKVSPEMDEGYLYILEPSQNRLAVFDKEGDFVIQYRDEGFLDLKDFAIDEDNGKIYFLDGNSIYQIDAQHLE